MSVCSLSPGYLPKVPFIVASYHQISFFRQLNRPSCHRFRTVSIYTHLKPKFSHIMTLHDHIKDRSAPLMNTESLKAHLQSQHFMELTRQEEIFAQELQQWHETMRSDNSTDYRSTNSSRQSHQSNASGTSVHYQQNMDNAISDDFSVGFPGDFHMVR